MDISKINTRTIAQKCSPVHIENVINDLVLALREAQVLADEVLALNPSCGELGKGKALKMQESANGLLNKLKET